MDEPAAKSRNGWIFEKEATVIGTEFAWACLANCLKFVCRILNQYRNKRKSPLGIRDMNALEEERSGIVAP